MPIERRGFTLIELMVALLLSALVVLVAHRVLTGIADAADELARSRAALDHDMNAHRWLIEAFGSLDIGAQSGGFSGRPERVEFATSQMVAAGWRESRRIALSLDGDSLVAVNDNAVGLVLARGVTFFRIDYLLDPGLHARWVREWISPVSAPLVVRMRVGYRQRVDTLLLLLGSRG